MARGGGNRDRVGEALDSLAADTSRRGFLARVGAGLVGLAFGGAIADAAQARDADAYTTSAATPTRPGPASTPRPAAGRLEGLTRCGPSDGRRVDNIGRLVNERGQPVHEDGSLMRDPDGNPLPPAPRTKICKETGKEHGFHAHLEGSWYRCCGGRVRKLWDCCAHHHDRINGDAALKGYCYGGRKVFCVTYYQTHVPC